MTTNLPRAPCKCKQGVQGPHEKGKKAPTVCIKGSQGSPKSTSRAPKGVPKWSKMEPQSGSKWDPKKEAKKRPPFCRKCCSRSSHSKIFINLSWRGTGSAMSWIERKVMWDWFFNVYCSSCCLSHAFDATGGLKRNQEAQKSDAKSIQMRSRQDIDAIRACPHCSLAHSLASLARSLDRLGLLLILILALILVQILIILMQQGGLRETRRRKKATQRAYKWDQDEIWTTKHFVWH